MPGIFQKKPKAPSCTGSPGPAGGSSGSTTATKKGCPLNVSLNIFQSGTKTPVSALTLKHDRLCDIEIGILPENANPSSWKVEIRRESETTWYTLPDVPDAPGDSKGKQVKKNWEAKIASKFKLRAVVNAQGTDHYSNEKDLEVQFPSYSDISSDSTVTAAANAAWAATLADTTPTQRRELAFWIQINTRTDVYVCLPTINGPFVTNSQGAYATPGGPPADIPITPDPNADGAEYTVALFHTHTPTTHRRFGRAIGPSGQDGRFHTHHDRVGLVYDYVGVSGNSPAGHPLLSPAQLYHSGPNRRSTP